MIFGQVVFRVISQNEYKNIKFVVLEKPNIQLENSILLQNQTDWQIVEITNQKDWDFFEKYGWDKNLNLPKNMDRFFESGVCPITIIKNEPAESLCCGGSRISVASQRWTIYWKILTKN